MDGWKLTVSRDHIRADHPDWTEDEITVEFSRQSQEALEHELQMRLVRRLAANQRRRRRP